MYSTEDTAEAVIKAACVLHNYLLKEDRLAQKVQDDMFKLGKKPHLGGVMRPLGPLHGYHTSMDARGVCDIFAKYFMATIGEVPWQYCCTHIDKS